MIYIINERIVTIADHFEEAYNNAVDFGVDPCYVNHTNKFKGLSDLVKNYLKISTSVEFWENKLTLAKRLNGHSTIELPEYILLK